MKRIRLREAERGTTSESRAEPIPAQLGSLEPNVELFRGRILLGNGERRVSAYMFDPPNELIEIHTEPGFGALTISEGEALSKWLHQRVLERRPSKPVGWFRRMLRLGQ